MPSITRFAGVPALVAALSLGAPLHAADLPAAPTHSAVEAAPAWSPADDTAANYRHYRYRHRRGPDVGDVLTGILIIGGIAAVTNAARDRDARSRYPDSRYPDNRYPDSRFPDDRRSYPNDDQGGDWGGDDARGLDRAVSMCVDAVERDQRIETVTSANRTARGWAVSGSLANGRVWTCSIGEDGRIEELSTDGQAQPYRSGEYAPDGDDRQWDDDRYAAERARVDGDEPGYQGGVAQGPVPEYPGEPLPDEDYEYADDDSENLDIGTGYPDSGAL